jgi:outer membrane protein assembly factor BamE (lipoprotein component of BamABCDE complex)
VTGFARFAIVALLVAATPACGGQMSFDKDRWAQEKGNYDGKNARGAMVGDLAAAGVSPGATKKRVRELLGEPDSTGPAADVYYLGRSASGPSFETYRIAYDPKGLVTSASLART